MFALYRENTTTSSMCSLVFNERTQKGNAHKRADSASGGHDAVPTREIKKHVLDGFLLEPQ